MPQATGAFDVSLTPRGDDGITGGAVSRMTIDKRYNGDLEGTGKGQMLAASTAVEGSAGYVAIELVSAKLEGRSGTFVLLHRGLMTRGTPSLSVTVVPDSGTGGLAGLAGEMAIAIDDGKHSYSLTYTLPAGE